MANGVGCRLTPVLFRGILLCCIVCFAMVGVTMALDFSLTKTGPPMVRVTTPIAPVNTTCPVGYDCMFPSEADAKWPGGYTQSNSGSCALVTTRSEAKVPKYCYHARVSLMNITSSAKAQPVVVSALAVAKATDTDKDGVPDISDNCLNVYNPDKADYDHDGIGNACDNCWYVNNTGQKDTNGTCRHLNFVSEYFDATHNAWIKDPACGDACRKPVLSTGSRDPVVAPLGEMDRYAGMENKALNPQPVPPTSTTTPTPTIGSLVHSPLLRQIKEKQPSPWDWLFGAVLCPGKTSCGNGCSDTRTDIYNCGGCGMVCPPGPAGSRGAAECINGKCIEHTCPNGQLYCDNAGKIDIQTAKPVGGCVDSRSDPNNCGTCGFTCSDLANCIQGHCLSRMALNKNVPDMSRIMFLTPQITQERYFTVAGKDFNYQSDEESISTLSMGDGYSDPRGWFVGTDSTVCISAPSDPEEQLFANHNILAGSQCGEGEKAYQTLEYRVKMFVDTNQFNGKPVQKATLKLSVAHTWMTRFGVFGEGYPNWQTIQEVWYKKTDSFPVSYPDAFNNLDPWRGVYLANIPTLGVGANHAIPPDFGSPATGGQAWGTGAIAVSGPQPQATWDPKARTLTIDMTDLVNEWITGHLENHGLVLKDGWPPSAPHALFSAYTFESFEVTP